jgi:SAM-dependent methyltransferase
MGESIPREAEAYYNRGLEAGRLFRSHGLIEFARTQEIILRHLPSPPCTVLDVGGGPGAYACWLASLGHRVVLVDAVPLHVEQARAASARQPHAPVADCRLGDARYLDEADASARAVLLLGPLYHLTERADRLGALREASRVLEPGGLLFAAAVSRYASLLSGVADNLLGDPEFAAIVARDLQDGQHRNGTDKDYFTTTFFHRPDELEAEVREAGFDLIDLVGVEGPGWLLPDLERRWADPAEREHLLEAARAVEREPTLLGLPPHLLAVAGKRGCG